MQAQNNCTFY